MATAAAHDLEDFLNAMAADRRMIHVERLPARLASTSALTMPLAPEIRDCLPIDEFWIHQALAIDLARTGQSVAIATGTASGKSLCYQVPIAEAIGDLSQPATALAMFPTKALAQDQLRSLTAFQFPHVVAATYDGDSNPSERTWVRSHANVILTNPDMLHHGILPNHARWATFLMRLRYVVVDELHTLRGVFGTHVAHLLRRLLRLCAHYGSRPTFLFSSATIGEPGNLASQLCGHPVTEIVEDGSPRGARAFVLWNPAIPIDAKDESEFVLDHQTPQRAFAATGRRGASSANRDSANLIAELIRRGHRTIAFCRSRKGTEVIAAEVRRRLPDELSELVRPYRGGYLAAERRAIESDLFSGKLLGVIATTALELGIDVGGLDACVVNGFPGTIASMWQQAGRAGRSTQESVVIVVAGDDQIDQWYMTHPDQVFTRMPEPAVTNLANPFILFPHLACAAYELPLGYSDDQWWPNTLEEGIRALAIEDKLKIRDQFMGIGSEPRAVWSGRGWPSRAVGLRSGSTREVRIARPDGTLVGTVDEARAGQLVHAGAVYLHQGQHYRVNVLDLDEAVAIVEPFDGSEWTQPRTTTEVTIVATDESHPVGRSHISLGSVQVMSQVVGFKRFEAITGKLIETEVLELPPSELNTRAFWYTIDQQLLDDADIENQAVPGTMHAIEHAAIGLLPLFTICDRWDVGGLSTPFHLQTSLPTIIIYDGYPGGAGIAELGFANAHRHLRATLDVIDTCACASGCPSCVQSPKCGNGNDPLDKHGATRLLRSLLANDVDDSDGIN
ncbi:MAG: DEAD/DEAH box helicase [Actinomycetes bacterium]